MEKMKYDMAGAATMLGAITAIARLGVKQRVSCLLGLVENMPSGTATRPGDIVQAMNGKTIEVINMIKLSSADAVSVISSLGGRIEEIGKILSVIDDVSEQTNLLALAKTNHSQCQRCQC